jgi:hypothetical protein
MAYNAEGISIAPDRKSDAIKVLVEFVASTLIIFI